MSDKDNKIDLYELLPVLYRLRDAERGYPLRAFLEIVSGQADIIKQNIDTLWDDFFIEICNEWVIPYIGDLVGNNPLHGVPLHLRADVAKTIYYRRRKGTLPMLEELAGDVTGWGPHAVAFFELLCWTQNLNHLRYQMAPNPEKIYPNAVDRVGTVNLRNPDALDCLDGPFDIIAHTVDVRPISCIQGWHNIRKIGFFLWRLKSYRMRDVTPRKSTYVEYGYHFSPLGNPASLFNNPEREADPTGLTMEIHVPGPIRLLAFHFDLEDYRKDLLSSTTPKSSYYGMEADSGLFIRKDNTPVPAESIVCMNLKDWSRPPKQLTYKDADGNDVTVDIVAGIDVCRGRIAFAEGQEPAEGTEVDYHYGFSADMGGGPYERRQDLAGADKDIWKVSVGQNTAADYNSLGLALADWMADSSKSKAIINITDNGTYVEHITIDFSGKESLVIQAADGKRPTLRIVDVDDKVAELRATGANSTDAAFNLNGLLMEGAIRIEPDSLGALRIAHCTLVPGRALNEDGEPVYPDAASVIVETPNARLEVEIDHSITGALRLPSGITGLKVTDSIIDSPLWNPPASQLPVLISGNLSPFPSLSSATPTVQVSIGNEGPYPAVLSGKPATLTQARNMLQEAIRFANNSPAFTGSRVISIPNRLVILPGTDGKVTIEKAEGDATAFELRLDSASSTHVFALITGELASFPTMSSASPKLNVTMGTVGPYEATLSLVPTSLPQACDRLQTAIRAVSIDQAFSAALVAKVYNRLMVIPGSPDTAVVFSAAPTDRTTITELSLEGKRPAIAFSVGGEYPGPGTTMERTTVFGKVHVKELTLASEVIFTELVVAQRRQAGCVRFSFVPLGSQTPRRYRCQPDMALRERAKVLKLDSVSDLPQADIIGICSQLGPVFTSIHYGGPGYAQLGLTCVKEIRTGAEDESEMGAFSLLKQPQRRSNLCIRLKEYLPFGLEAGLIYVT